MKRCGSSTTWEKSVPNLIFLKKSTQFKICFVKIIKRKAQKPKTLCKRIFFVLKLSTEGTWFSSNPKCATIILETRVDRGEPYLHAVFEERSPPYYFSLSLSLSFLELSLSLIFPPSLLRARALLKGGRKLCLRLSLSLPSSSLCRAGRPDWSFFAEAVSGFLKNKKIELGSNYSIVFLKGEKYQDQLCHVYPTDGFAVSHRWLTPNYLHWL